MSDPVTNVDIEDVLSSIRRLVADNEWHRDLPPAKPSKVEEAMAGADRFVLTPALRVVEDEENAEENDSGEAFAVSPEAARMTQLERMIAELEAAISNQNAAAQAEPVTEPEVAEVAPETDLAALVQDAVEAEVEATIADAIEEVAEAADDVEDTFEEAPFIEAVDIEESHVTRFMRSKVQIEEVEYAEDQDETPEPVITFHHFQGRGELAEDIPEVALEEPDAEALAALETSVEDLVEAAIEEPNIEPVLADALNEGEAPDHDLDQLDDHDIHPEEDEALEQYLGGKAALDHDMLRNLVTEIVRQELQGALGERITRNVRKLVRREIYRVLSSQEFE